MILSYQREHKVLPESFEALSRYSHRMLPTDPETGAPYAYEVLSQSSYRLCANFRAERRAETGPLLNPSPFAFHPAGEKCFLRSEEHTPELQSLMRISYAVFCLKKKKTKMRTNKTNT